MILFSEYLTRIGCAFVMGTFIGVERQIRQRNAGLRTNILVSIAAAAFTILSYSMTTGNGDPSRVAAQIVSGIGFLGGGLILKDGLTVRGLNTAATIWCSAACGTLSGVGLYKEAAILVICVLLTHCLFRPLCALLEKRTAKVYHYSIRAECQRNASNSIQKLIMDTLAFDQDVQLNSLFYKGDDERVTVCCDMATLGEHKVLLDLVVSRLRSRSEVYSVGWEKKESPQEDF
uniref:MgtC/SapB family protein n=1 Tax=Prevotella sp. TaxID=59823 RepID=UPI004025AA75